MKKRTYVLVHGAWHGGFVWRDVAAAIRAQGHLVTTPTLSGLGERKNFETNKVDLQTHIDDVVNHIEMEDLDNIDLVGWSYGGAVVTGVLACLQDRVRSVIYVDAFVPENGKALIDYSDGPLVPVYNEAKDKDLPVPPIPLEVFGVSDPEVISFINPRLVHQPWRTIFQPVQALEKRPDIPFTYVHCLGFKNSPFGHFHDKLKAEGVTTMQIEASHLCMMDAPQTVTEILLKSS